MKTILLIDDEETTRDFLTRIIARKGYKVFSAATGKDGLVLYQEKSPDCVFLDVNLEDTDGGKVFGEMKAISKVPKIYFMTGSISFDEIAKELGADGYIVKPIDLDALLKILDNL